MDKEKLRELRTRYMTPQRILCTGNPDVPYTIASGVKELWPDATFVSKSLGYDLEFTEANTSDRFEQLLKQHNVFINASRLYNGAQLKLLEIANRVWKYGHVVNIGSAHEYRVDDDYSRSKLELRKRSIALNTYRFRTTHIILGGIKNHLPERQEWMTSIEIAHCIKWVLDSPYDIPILGFEQPKTPW